MTGPAIALKDLRKTYRAGSGAVEALRGVTLQIERGSSVAITGPSGSGKSTLLQIIGALDSQFEGEAKIFGTSLRGLSDRQRCAVRAHKVGFVFQTFELLPHLSALDNVMLPAAFAKNEHATQKRALALLDRMGLGGREKSRPIELSGGQQQRVAIARALFLKPPLLLCDEPTGNLDTVAGDLIVETLMETCRDDDTTVIVITHQPRVSGAMERSIRLVDGRVEGGVDSDGAEGRPSHDDSGNINTPTERPAAASQGDA